jgi:cytochrome c-type biogenesis protein CcmE
VRRRTRHLVAAIVTMGAMTTVLIGTLESSVPFVSPGQLNADLDGRRVQVEGIVESITPQHDQLRLELSDGGSATVVVTYAYTEHRPLTLEAGRVVVAKGPYRDGVVEANQVSVRAHEP